MVEPVTGGLIAGALLKQAGDALGVAADLHGLRAGRLLRRLTERFESAPNDAPIFFHAIWRAAVQATHGCVQQVYEHTPVSDAVRGDTPTWDRFREAHRRVRKVREWGDTAELPHTLQGVLTGSLPQTLRTQAGANDQTSSDPAHAVWACYCDALRNVGLEGEPPAVIRQAFFGERPEPSVWPWSKHFALRIGEQLRGNVGFKAMFDAAQFAGIGAGVARLITEFEAVEQTLKALLQKIDEVQGTVSRIEQGTIELNDKMDRFENDLRELKRRFSPAAIGLNEEIERLRQRPDIRIEDLIGWLQTALDRPDPLPPEALPKLLEQALTVDLPKLRAQVESYRLDPLASPEAQVLLGEVRALLRPQAGTPLDLHEAREKLKALDDRVVAERVERRRREDRELAELRVLRADTERASASYAAAAELMEQAAGLYEDADQARIITCKAAEDWRHHGALHPGVYAFERSIELLNGLIDASKTDKECHDLRPRLASALASLGHRLGDEAGLRALRGAESNYCMALDMLTHDAMSVERAISQRNLGVVQLELGKRLGAESGLHALRTAEVSFRMALEVLTHKAMPLDWASTVESLGGVQLALGERMGGEFGLQALREAEASYRAVLVVRTRKVMPVDWASTQNSLGIVQLRMGQRLAGEEGLERFRFICRHIRRNGSSCDIPVR